MNSNLAPAAGVGRAGEDEQAPRREQHGAELASFAGGLEVEDARGPRAEATTVRWGRSGKGEIEDNTRAQYFSILFMSPENLERDFRS